MVSRLEKTLIIDVPGEVYFEYDYASQDGVKPANFRLTGPVGVLKGVLEEALRALGEAV